MDLSRFPQMENEDKVLLDMSESDLHDLMLEIERLAEMLGYRNFAKSGSENTVSSDILNLIDSKADSLDVLKHDGSVSLTDDWDVGDGKKIIVDQIMARDSDGLALYEDNNNGIFIKDGGNIGIGVLDPKRKVHISLDTVGTTTMIAYENPNTTNGNGITHSFRTTTTGPTGSIFKEVGAFAFVISDHAGATYTSKLSIYVANSGVLNDTIVINPASVEINGDLDHDGSNVGFFGKTPVGQRLKANYNNWASLSDVVQALVDIGLFDQV